MQLDRSIFKAYDIRGIVGKTLTEDVVRGVGEVLATWAARKGIQTMCVGRDGRLSGPSLSTALMQGIVSAGVNVKDIGMQPTPGALFRYAPFRLRLRRCCDRFAQSVGIQRTENDVGRPDVVRT